MAARPPRHRRRPRDVPHAAHRGARLARPARGPDPGERRARRTPPARPARLLGRGAHRHRRPAGLGRRRPAPRRAGARAGAGHPRAHRVAGLRPGGPALRRGRVSRAYGGGEPAVRGGPRRRHAPGLRAGVDRRPGPGDRGGRAVGVGPARARRAGLLSHPPDGGGGARAPGPDQPALRLQLPRGHRQLRAHRPRPRPRAVAGVRRLHPLLLSPPRRVHDPGRGAEVRRALPPARAGSLRRAAAGHAVDRAGGAAGRGAVPVHPAAGRERRAPRPRGRRGRRPHPHHRPRPGPRVPHRGRGRRPRRGPRPRAAGYGDEYGLVVETAPGAGTKVVVRVPKFAPGVHA